MDVKKIRHRPAATVGTVRESHQVDRRNWLAVVKVVQEFAPKSAEAEKTRDFWYALYVRPRFEKLVIINSRRRVTKLSSQPISAGANGQIA